MRYLLPLLPLLFILAACSNDLASSVDAGATVCLPGIRVACTCGAGPGSQVCADDGRSLSPCRCLDAGQTIDVGDELGPDVDQVVDTGGPDAPDAGDAGADVVAIADVVAVADVVDASGVEASADVGSADVLPAGCVSTTVGNCCGVACTGAAHAAPVCGGGACALSCNAGYGDCDGSAANGCEATHATDDTNCGACGNACTMGQHCVGGACRCPDGHLLCGGRCTDVRADAANCGACGAPCAAGRVCMSAACVACPSGQTACGGTCVTTSTDPLHCNGCDNRCPLRPNATRLCTAGACSFSCDAGFANCDGDPGNGCETNTATGDPNNCGRCGGGCPAPAGTLATCAASRCGTMLSTCPAGTGNCDGNASNGCEVNTNTALAHCGACGRSCSARNATVSCIGGACVLGACSPGYVDCDGDPATGCESYPPQDYQNCGACGRSCPVPANAGPACRGGACTFICYGGYADCNRDPSDGCEQGINPSMLGSTTCRACGTRCGNSCYDLQTQQANCGACGRSCTGLYFCRAGACVCPDGLSDCGGSCVDTATSDSNCGACGNRCMNGRVCRSSACVFV